MHDRLGSLADEQRMLLDTALKALDALKVGNIGLMGATGTVLEDSLLKLRDLIDRSLPEIRTASGMVTHPDPVPAPPYPKRPDEQTPDGAGRSLDPFEAADLLPQHPNQGNYK